MAGLGTYVVWLDYNNKWHCWTEEDPMLAHLDTERYADEGARKTAGMLVHGTPEGTAWFLRQAKASFAIHAPNPYRAISMAKQEYKRFLLES